MKDVFELNFHINIGVLLESMPIGIGLIASDVGSHFIIIDHRCLQELVKDAYENGLVVFAYTVTISIGSRRLVLMVLFQIIQIDCEFFRIVLFKVIVLLFTGEVLFSLQSV